MEIEMNKKAMKILAGVCFVIILVFLPYVAQLATADEIGSDNAGVSFVWIMFPSWLYVGGAIIMLTLGLKSLSGGALAKPFTLMGVTLFIDAITQMVSSLVVISLIPEMKIISQLTFAFELIFRLSIVFSMVWIASIFGVLKFSKKPEPAKAPPTTTASPQSGNMAPSAAPTPTIQP